MGKALRHDAALCLLLQAVVADGRGSGQAASRSPGSSTCFMVSVCLPQTPARQSACSSMRTDKALASRSLTLAGRHLVGDAEQVLNVMADLRGR